MRLGVISEMNELIGIVDTNDYRFPSDVINKIEEIVDTYGKTPRKQISDGFLMNFSKPINQINMDEVFFMNYAEGQSAPAYKFTDLDDAMAEAARISTNIKQPVYTLKAIKRTKPRIIDELNERALPEKSGD